MLEVVLLLGERRQRLGPDLLSDHLNTRGTVYYQCPYYGPYEDRIATGIRNSRQNRYIRVRS